MVVSRLIAFPLQELSHTRTIILLLFVCVKMAEAVSDTDPGWRFTVNPDLRQFHELSM